MSQLADEQHGLRLLVLDGGGIRGLSEVLILNELMHRIQHERGLQKLPLPCDYFHLIGGTSTGGLLALMLGRLRMSTEQVLKEYPRLAKNVFSIKKSIGSDGTFKASKLKEEVGRIVKVYGTLKDPEEAMLDTRSENICRTFVCAEAARATSAAATFFKRIKIGEAGMEEEFIDGAMGCNNPVPQVIEEAELVFGSDRRVDCILSIGTGQAETVGLRKPDAFQRVLPTKIIGVLKELATESERTAERLARSYKNVPGVYFRLNVEQGLQGVSLAEWNKLGEIRTNTTAYLKKSDVTAKVDEAVAALTRGRVTEGPMITIADFIGPAVSKPRKRNIHFSVPHSTSALFTGREEILERLKEYFFSQQSPDSSSRKRVFVLYGLGGSGKTQICLRFVEKHRDRFWGIFWIDASTPDTAEQSFCEIAHEIGTKESSKDVKRWLANCEDEWLLIIDNADDPTFDVSKHFPPGNTGNILMTTRNPECRQHAPNAHQEINVMSPDEATSLLLKTQNLTELSDESQKQAAGIVKELGYLALAIDQARAYIANGCPLGEFLSTYQAHRKKLMSSRSVQGSEAYKWTVYTTWEISFEVIHERNPLASEILQIFAFLHYDRIPEEILKRASNNLQEMSDDGTLREQQKPSGLSKALIILLQQQRGGNWDPFEFEEGIRALLSFSMIKRDIYQESNIYSIHPLVHSWNRDRLDLQTQRALKRSATYLLSHSIPLAVDPLPDIRFRQQLLPHVESCRQPLEGYTHDPGLELNEHLGQLVGFALVYGEAGKYKQAEELQTQVLDVRKNELGEEHPSTLISISDLASTISEQGRWKEAEKLYMQVLEVRKKQLGEAHPDTLSSMSTLATIYLLEGRWKEAEELQLQALTVCKKELGEAHPLTLSSITTLAATYSLQGRWKEADELQVQILDTRKKELGEAHPTTLASMSHLALTYSKQGRWKKAEELQAQVLEVRKKELGEMHPNTLAAISDLASTYSEQGRWKEAEELGVQVLEAYKTELGEMHPDTLRSMDILAVAYSRQGRWNEGEVLQVQVLAARKKELGEVHPEALSSMSTLAETYSLQGRWREAEELQLQALAACRTELGEAHPDTLASMSSLASTYSFQGRWKKAEELGIQVLDARKRELGDMHPRTLASMSSLASTYYEQGHWKKAEELEALVLAARKEELGEAHPDTLVSMNNLAMTYVHRRLWMGRKKAKELQLYGLAVSKKELGETHPDTLVFMSNLARSYSRRGQWKKAQELEEQVLAAHKKELGETHPETLISMSNLSVTYIIRGWWEGRWRKAEELQLQVLAACRKEQGEAHPMTLISMKNLVFTYGLTGRFPQALQLFKQRSELKRAPRD